MDATKQRELREYYELLQRLDQYRTDNRFFFMDFHLYEKQGKTFDAVTLRLQTKDGPDEFGIMGANRSGKSETGGGITSEVAINKGFKYGKDLRIWCATWADLSVKVQQRKLDEILPKSEIYYGEYNPVRGWKNRIIETKSGTVINIKTYDQGWKAFQGDDVDLIWFDEECPYDVYKESMIRLGDRMGVMMITFTSLQGFTRLVNRLWKANNPKVYNVVLTAKENPHLTKKAKEQLYASIDPDERKSRWDGEPHLKAGLIYKTFCNFHQIPRFNYFNLLKSKKFKDRFEIHEGIDPHSRTPHHWLRFLYDKDADIIYIVEEFKAPREAMDIQTYAKLIKLKRYGIEPKITQIDTSSETPIPIRKAAGEEQIDRVTIRTEFRAAGIETQLVMKDNAVGINSVKNRLRYYVNGKGELIKPPRLYVFNDCSGVLWEFSRYAWANYDSDLTQEKRELLNIPVKKNDHYMDILKYESLYVNIVIKGGRQEAEDFELYPGTGV